MKPSVSRLAATAAGAGLIAHAITTGALPHLTPPTLGVGAGLILAATLTQRTPWEALAAALAAAALQAILGPALVGPATQATLALALALAAKPPRGAPVRAALPWLALGATAYAALATSPPGEWLLAISAVTAAALAPGTAAATASAAGLAAAPLSPPGLAAMAPAAAAVAREKGRGAPSFLAALVAPLAVIDANAAAVTLAASAAALGARVLAVERLAVPAAAGGLAALVFSDGDPGIVFAAAFLAVLTQVALASRREAIAIAALALLVLAPAVAGPAEGQCPQATVLGYEYVSSGNVAVEGGPDSGLLAEALAAAPFDYGDPLERLVAASKAAALIVSPGALGNVTIVDFTTGSNETVDARGAFLILPIDSPVVAYYAVEPGEEPTFRVAVELANVIIPPEAVGGLPISPVHNALAVEFQQPLLVEAAGGYKIEVYEAVLASTTVARGGPVEAEDTPAGVLWKGAVLGVTRGLIIAPDGSALPAPAPAGPDLVELQVKVAALWASNEALALALSAAALADNTGGGWVPEAVGVSASLDVGAAGMLVLLSPERVAARPLPAPSFQSVDVCMYHAEPGTVEVAGVEADYALAQALSTAGGAEEMLAIAEAWTGDAGEAARLAWVAAQWSVIARLDPPPPSVGSSLLAWGVAPMLGVFVAAALGAVFGEPRELAPGAEP